ncbi:TRAP-type C4-dicarboxylate transport system, substrate-binding protein [Amycolatopsis marina]|uniref:TRAP-type C4-dicarboxylate transport system, substrate-binding protein n=1 Tax=Amycolatopsis marina TaxID=490629 RepID=A0A1I1C7E9_9PSEU|nr:TRAP transporter substrate-binding protein DctP [Amycolatopsis marina]SFB56353.1 TRAP-type C4-dicarboxylate transport system, substrate-binding protein [Amycolatopsis marina]
MLGESRYRRSLPVLTTAVLLLAVAACGTDTDGADAGGELATMSPVTLRVQSAHGPDAAASRAFDAWKEAVEEASEGKLQFEMFYGGALAPLTETEEGLAAGLVDIASHAPIYNPAQFPAENVIQQMNSVIAPQPLAGTLQALGAQTELALEEVYPPQFEEQGLHPLLVPATVIPAYHLVCTDDPVRTLDEAEGTRVRVPSEHLGSEAEALGMTPTATTIAELYEAMERGVVDCALAAPSDIRDLGLIDVVDHWILDPEVMWSGVSSFHVSISKTTWDGLPVAAQRILWDTAGEVFLRTMTEAALADTAEAITQAQQGGVRFHRWNEDIRGALRGHQQTVAGSATAEMDRGEEFGARFAALHDEWLNALPELGYEPSLDASFEEFASGFTDSGFDLGPFVSRVVEVRSAHRP